MTIFVILVVALVFGVSAVLEGLLWALLITVALLVAAAWFGWRALGGARRSS